MFAIFQILPHVSRPLTKQIGVSSWLLWPSKFSLFVSQESKNDGWGDKETLWLGKGLG